LGVKADPIRFGDIVAKRRSYLGLTRQMVAARGGPAIMTQYNIEHALGQEPRPATFYAYDQALAWKPGSAARTWWAGAPVDDDLADAQRAAAPPEPPQDVDVVDDAVSGELARRIAADPSIRIAARRLADLSSDDVETFLDLLTIVEKRGRTAPEGE
jgi:hypothetical protein